MTVCHYEILEDMPAQVSSSRPLFPNPTVVQPSQIIVSCLACGAKNGLPGGTTRFECYRCLKQSDISKFQNHVNLSDTPLQIDDPFEGTDDFESTSSLHKKDSESCKNTNLEDLNVKSISDESRYVYQLEQKARDVERKLEWLQHEASRYKRKQATIERERDKIQIEVVGSLTDSENLKKEIRKRDKVPCIYTFTPLG